MCPGDTLPPCHCGVVTGCICGVPHWCQRRAWLWLLFSLISLLWEPLAASPGKEPLWPGWKTLPGSPAPLEASKPAGDYFTLGEVWQPGVSYSGKGNCALKEAQNLLDVGAGGRDRFGAASQQILPGSRMPSPLQAALPPLSLLSGGCFGCWSGNEGSKIQNPLQNQAVVPPQT